MLVVVVLALLDPCALLCDGCILIAQCLVDQTPIHFEFLAYLGGSNGLLLSVNNPSWRLSLVLLFYLFFHDLLGEGLITTRPCALGEAHFRSTFPAGFGYVSISVVVPAAW